MRQISPTYLGHTSPTPNTGTTAVLQSYNGISDVSDELKLLAAQLSFLTPVPL